MLPFPVPSKPPHFLNGPFFPGDRALQPKGLRHSRGVAASGFPHCAKFLTAASRRSLGRVPVPVWLIILSDQLDIVDNMVGLYPTINLMSRRLIPRQGPKASLTPPAEANVVLSGISAPFETLSRTKGQITHALLTRAPLY